MYEMDLPLGLFVILLLLKIFFEWNIAANYNKLWHDWRISGVNFITLIYHALCAFFFKAKNVMHSLSLGFHIPRV